MKLFQELALILFTYSSGNRGNHKSYWSKNHFKGEPLSCRTRRIMIKPAIHEFLQLVKEKFLWWKKLKPSLTVPIRFSHTMLLSTKFSLPNVSGNQWSSGTVRYNALEAIWFRTMAFLAALLQRHIISLFFKHIRLWAILSYLMELMRKPESFWPSLFEGCHCKKSNEEIPPASQKTRV